MRRTHVPVRNGPDRQRRNHVTCHVQRLRHRHQTLLLTHQVELGERTQKEAPELELWGIPVPPLLKAVRFSYLRHDSGSTFGRIMVPSVKARAGAVEAVSLDGAQVPVHGREHPTALELPIGVDGQGEVLPMPLGEVPSIQDPVGVAAVRETHAPKHLADGLEGGEQGGQAQDEQQPLLEGAELTDLPNDVPESSHADGRQRSLVHVVYTVGNDTMVSGAH